MNKIFFKAICLLIASLLVFTGLAFSAGDEDVDAAIKGGQQYLMAKQVEAVYDNEGNLIDGGNWTDSQQQWEPLASTAFAVAALLETKVPYTEKAISDGISYIKKFVQNDGGIYDDANYANYINATCLISLSLYGKALAGDGKDDSEYKTLVQNAVDYTLTKQSITANNEPLSSDDPYYGSWTYRKRENNEEPVGDVPDDGNQWSYGDLSNTQYAVMGLWYAYDYLVKFTGAEPWAEKLLVYLGRSHGWYDEEKEETWNDQDWAKGKNTSGIDGAFSYKPDYEDFYPGGSMTGAGIWSLAMIGQDQHPMIDIAIEWFDANYAWDKNPGSYYVLSNAAYYYYVYTMAKALTAARGTQSKVGEHDWVQDVKDTMIAKKIDVSNTDPAQNYWKGTDSLDGGDVIATSWVLMSLAFAVPEVESHQKLLAQPDDLDNPIKGLVTLSVTGSVTISDAIRINIADAVKDAGVELPIGGFEFTLSDVSLGLSTVMTIKMPMEALNPENPNSFVNTDGTVKEGLAWFKIQNGKWVGVPDVMVEIDLVANVIRVTLTDGGFEDADGKADGIIMDPGAPGYGFFSCETEAVFTANPTTGDVPLTVNFDATGSTGDTYTWNYGDGVGKDTGIKSTYEYEYSGTYMATLTVSSEDGKCKDMEKLKIIVSGDNYMPGNVDGIGGVDIFDALALAEYDVYKDTPGYTPPPGIAAADVNGDGLTDINDALNIALYDAKLITSPDADTIAPEVSSVSPADGATGVPVDGVITVTFSENMDEATINSESFFITTSDGTIVSGTATYSDKTATFTPEAALTDSTTYTATITTDAKDISGNSLKSDFVWSFTTAIDFSKVITATNWRLFVTETKLEDFAYEVTLGYFKNDGTWEYGTWTLEGDQVEIVVTEDGGRLTGTIAERNGIVGMAGSGISSEGESWRWIALSANGSTAPEDNYLEDFYDLLPEELIVIFPDENIEAVVREAIDKSEGDILASDLEGLTELYVNGMEIENIAGLQYCTGLTYLDLGWNYDYDNPVYNKISDIKHLAKLTNLEYLLLEENQVSDITPLDSLTNLKVLYMTSNQVSDISALAELVNLTELVMNSNQIDDISALENLTNLNAIDLGYNNDISDISALENLASLTRLWLSGNQISDISPLANLTNLTELYLNENLFSDISVLDGLTGLIRFEIGGTQVSDISVLAGLTNLTTLALYDVPVNDFSALSALSGLTELYMNDTLISDLSVISGLTGLETLYLENTQLSDLTPIAGFTNLSSLYLTGSPISEASCIIVSQLKAAGVSVYSNCGGEG